MSSTGKLPGLGLNYRILQGRVTCDTRISFRVASHHVDLYIIRNIQDDGCKYVFVSARCIGSRTASHRMEVSLSLNHIQQNYSSSSSSPSSPSFSIAALIGPSNLGCNSLALVKAIVALTFSPDFK